MRLRRSPFFSRWSHFPAIAGNDLDLYQIPKDKHVQNALSCPKELLERFGASPAIQADIRILQSGNHLI